MSFNPGGGGIGNANDVALNAPASDEILTYDGNLLRWRNKILPGVTDATTTIKGQVQLAGDLAGTAAAPTVPGLAGKASVSDPRFSDARTPIDASVTNAKVAAGAAIDLTKLAGLIDGAGKIVSTLLPALAITSRTVVASQAEMLALVAQEGDIAIRSDVSRTFVLGTGASTVLSSWAELLSPTGAVSSVAGRTGAVTLATADVSGLQTVLTDLQTTKAEASELASYALLTQVPLSARARLSADFPLANGSNTLQNVTGLSWAIGANVQQDFSAIIHYSGEGSGAGGADFKLAFTGPAGCAFTAVVQANGSGSTGVSGGQMLQPIRSLADVVTAIGAFDVSSALLINGTLVNGATAGTIQFQAAQNVAVAVTIQTKVLSGSLFLAVNA